MQMQNATTFTRTDVISGARQSLPLFIGVIPFGLVFGVTARQTGLGLSETTLMSSTVFAGAAQFVALSLWHEPLPVLTIVFTTFLVNLRFLLMGATLRPWFERLTFWQAYGSALVLADASWALQLKEFNESGRNGAVVLGGGVAQLVGWIFSTVLGFVLGAAITQPEKWGLDFVVTASFLALLVGMWRGKSDILPWLIAAAAALAASHFLMGNWYILIGGLAGSLSGAFLDRGANTNEK